MAVGKMGLAAFIKGKLILNTQGRPRPCGGSVNKTHRI